MRLNETYSVPDHIVQDMTRYDPYLRLRWGRAQGRVRLERKIDREKPMDPRNFRFDPDGYDMARQGYTLVGTFEPQEFAYQMLVRELWKKDLQRRGWRVVADETEAEENRAREKEELDRKDEFMAIGREAWRHMNTVKTVPEGAGHRAYLGNGQGSVL